MMHSHTCCTSDMRRLVYTLKSVISSLFSMSFCSSTSWIQQEFDEGSSVKFHHFCWHPLSFQLLMHIPVTISDTLIWDKMNPLRGKNVDKGQTSLHILHWCLSKYQKAAKTAYLSKLIANYIHRPHVIFLTRLQIHVIVVML